jgi:hypothetical protein
MNANTSRLVSGVGRKLEKINLAAAKVLPVVADQVTMMMNPISSSNTSHANQTVQSALPKPQPQQQTVVRPLDTVTLKSIGKVDNDGDTK